MATLMDYFSTSKGWVYFIAPLILGVLHGIEPRHLELDRAPLDSANEGIFWRPVLLGLAAALSHTLMIWIIATGASHFGSHWQLAGAQPYLELVSALLTFALAVRGFFRLQGGNEQAPALERHLATQALGGRYPKPASHILVSGAAIGMMPCPLTLGVLLACLQSGRLMLGMTLAVCFGVGLALSMATAGSVGVWFTRRAEDWHLDLNGLRQRISFIFCIFLALLGCVIAWRALDKIMHL